MVATSTMAPLPAHTQHRLVNQYHTYFMVVIRLGAMYKDDETKVY